MRHQLWVKEKRRRKGERKAVEGGRAVGSGKEEKIQDKKLKVHFSCVTCERKGKRQAEECYKIQVEVC